jgi:hypothetical protein
MTPIDERSFVQCDPVVGDVLRFEDYIEVMLGECSDVGHRPTESRVVLARVVRLLHQWLHPQLLAEGEVGAVVGYILEVVESTGPEELAVGATICRTCYCSSTEGHLRVPRADESKRQLRSRR